MSGGADSRRGQALTAASWWLTDAQLITPRGIVRGALRVANGRIAAIGTRAPRDAPRRVLHGAYVAPGFIDLHVWGDPETVALRICRSGATGFLTTLGPAKPRLLQAAVRARAIEVPRGAACLGLHLEGPFVNPARAGALPARWMRSPRVAELARLARAARGRLRLVTIAPERPGAPAAIRWMRRQRIVASLGHSSADGATAQRAVRAGARAVTHIFNAMPPWHHREPGLVGVALHDARLTAMVIADGVHVGAEALRWLARTKGPSRLALVTDSVADAGWPVVKRRGAYWTRGGRLAGSALTMMEAVRNMVQLARVSLADAVTMAGATPARLLGLRDRGALRRGARADLTVFDRRFRVLLTMVGGHIVYERRS